MGLFCMVVASYPLNKPRKLFYIQRRIIPLLLPIDCLSIAFDAHMFSHNGYGPGTKDQGPKAAGPQVPAQQLLGLCPWSRAHIHYG